MTPYKSEASVYPRTRILILIRRLHDLGKNDPNPANNLQDSILHCSHASTPFIQTIQTVCAIVKNPSLHPKNTKDRGHKPSDSERRGTFDP